LDNGHCLVHLKMLQRRCRPRMQWEAASRRPDWLFEFKYDGFRALCYFERGCCRLISRNGNVLRRFEALGDQVAAALDVDEAVIDGEVIAVTPPEFTRRDFGTVTRTRPVSRLRALFPQ